MNAYETCADTYIRAIKRFRRTAGRPATRRCIAAYRALAAYCIGDALVRLAGGAR